MGATDGQVRRTFIFEGLCLGMLGAFAGISVGLVICWAIDRLGLPLQENAYYMDRLPV